MRRIWRGVRALLITVGALFGTLVVLSVILKLSGALDENRNVAPPAAMQAKAAAAKVSADEYVRYIWGLGGRDARAIVWQDARSLAEARRLLASGDVSEAKGNLDRLMQFVACEPKAGTRVEQLAIGMETTTVEVKEGDATGCRGDVENSLLTRTREPWLHGGQ